jgi:hypothetical protein
MSHKQRFTLELVIMAQAKYMHDLAILSLVCEPGKIGAIDVLLDEQKKMLAGYFQNWDDE